MPDQGPSGGEYPRLHRGHHDAPQGGTTDTSYAIRHGGMYPRALQSSSLQPGTTEVPHAPLQPPIGSRPPTEIAPKYSVQSADSLYSPGFIRQQIQRQMNLARALSQGSAGAWNSLARSNSHQLSSKSHSPYNHGGFRVVRQQYSRPIAAAPPSQGPLGVQNAWVPFPQVYLDFTFCVSLLLNSLGLRWPLRSGKRLLYVTVIQNTEHAY